MRGVGLRVGHGGWGSRGKGEGGRGYGDPRGVTGHGGAGGMRWADTGGRRAGAGQEAWGQARGAGQVERMFDRGQGGRSNGCSIGCSIGSNGCSVRCEGGVERVFDRAFDQGRRGYGCSIRGHGGSNGCSLPTDNCPLPTRNRKEVQLSGTPTPLWGGTREFLKFALVWIVLSEDGLVGVCLGDCSDV